MFWVFQRKVLKTIQVNRMSRSRRVLAIGGKQRILRLDMVCIETILFHLDSLWGIRTTYRSIVYRMMITLKTIHLFELNLFEFKSHLNSEMQWFGPIFRIHQLIFISFILFLLDSQPPLECITSLWNESVKYNSKILVKHLFICNFMTVVSCLWVAFRSEVCWVAVGGKACAC